MGHSALGLYSMTESAKLNAAMDRLAFAQMHPDAEKYLEDGETTVAGRSIVNAVREGGKPKPDTGGWIFLTALLLILASLGFIVWWNSVRPPGAVATQASQPSLSPGSTQIGITSSGPPAN